MRPASLTDALLGELADQFGTPTYVYCAQEMRERVERLAGLETFDRVRYAQKANSNLSLLRLLRSTGVCVDAVSAGEVRRALAAGFEPSEITYTADLFDLAALEVLREHPGVAVNVGSACMLEDLARIRERGSVTLRVNPRFGAGHGARVATGGLLSKHGIWAEELPEAIARSRELDLRVTGLHMHIGSGAGLADLVRTCGAMRWAARLVGPDLEYISAGGGLPDSVLEPDFDVVGYARAWHDEKLAIEAELDRSIELEVEPGRFLTAEAGVLLARVSATKRNRSLEFALLDAGFNDLVRPVLYGAAHPIEVLTGRAPGTPRPTIVAGPLCESADVFSVDADGHPTPILLPPLEVGDLVLLTVAGAYGASMSSTYNSRPLAAEVLVEDGRARLIRRRQTFEDLVRSEVE